jgi:hypothetical protein
MIDLFKTTTAPTWTLVSHEIDEIVELGCGLLHRRRGPLMALGFIRCGARNSVATKAYRTWGASGRAQQSAVPIVGQLAAAGGLMSYRTPIPDNYRQVGIYIGRILKAEKVAGLSIMQENKIELMVNLETIKTLGLTCPGPCWLLQAK